MFPALIRRILQPLNFSPVAWLVLAGCLWLALRLDRANEPQVFAGNGVVHFVDADCYSRMTRVREVCAHPGEIIRWHEFENYPAGVRPHTTALFDYLVAGFRALLWPIYRAAALDFAGAWISPLLGLGTLAGLWWWAMREKLPGYWLMLLVFAASPILAQGFALGRPDHQSLALACMAAALAAEWSLWRAPSRGWGFVSATAWALGLWTTLYEPTILLALTLIAGALFHRAVFRQRERLPGLALGAAILLAALAGEGWRVGVPGGAGNAGEYFAAWSRQIGELNSLYPWSPTLYAWTGLGLLAAPVLLWLSRDPAQRRIARAQGLLLGAVFALTCWQVRWGYFLALVYAMSLPQQLGALTGRRRVWAGVALALGLWPMWAEWSGRLIHPGEAARAQLAEQRDDAARLREAAAFIEKESAARAAPADDQGLVPAGILAPWWLSPPLAYWSGQPAVAGSSHESLPGTVDVARFSLTADPHFAAAILRARRVRWVVAYEPERVYSTAASLLNQAQISRRAMSIILYKQPEAVPPFLRPAFVNQYFRVYEVQPALLPP